MAATAGAGVGAGGFAGIAAAQTSSALVPSFNNAAGTAVDATGDVVCLGFNSSVTTLCMNQRVESTKVRSRVIFGKMGSTTATVTIGASDFGITRSSAGVYVVTFKKAFSRTPVVVCCGVAALASVKAPVISAKSATGVTVTCSTEAGAATDSQFYIAVFGQDTRDEQGGRFRYLQNSQRKPRMLGARVLVAGPTVSVGSEDFTIVKNGPGDFTLTILRPFKREPIVIGASRSNRFQCYSATASTISINTLAAGGGSADSTSFDIIVIGSDDPSEY